MTKATAEYIRNVLKLHQGYTLTEPTKKARDIEKAYTKGLFDMLQIIGTEAYTIPCLSCNDILTAAGAEPL